MFRRSTAILSCVLLGVPYFAQAQAAPTPRKIVVRKGVVLHLTNLQLLDSATAKPGDRVPLKLVRPLLVDGTVLLPEGEVLYGTITRVKHAGKDCHDGSIRWRVESITLPDASKAKAHLMFATPGTVPVPDVMPKRDHHAGSEALEGIPGVMEGAIWFIVLAPLLILFLPSILDQQAEDKAKACGGHAGHEFQLPENSTVAVAISREHTVQH